MLIDRFYNAVFNIDLNDFDVEKNVFPIFVIHDSWNKVPLVKNMFTRSYNDTPISLVQGTISKFFSHYQTYNLSPDFAPGADIEECFMNISKVLVAKNSLNMNDVKFYNGVFVYVDSKALENEGYVNNVSTYARFIAESFSSLHIDISILIDRDVDPADARLGKIINDLYKSLNKMTANMRSENANYRIFAYKLSDMAGSNNVESIKNLTEVMIASMYASCARRSDRGVEDSFQRLKDNVEGMYYGSNQRKWSPENEDPRFYHTRWYTVNQVKYNTPRKKFVNDFLFSSVLSNISPLTDSIIDEVLDKITYTYEGLIRGYKENIDKIASILTGAIHGTVSVGGGTVMPNDLSNMLYINLYANSCINLIDDIIAQHIKNACNELVGYGDEDLREHIRFRIKEKITDNAKAKYSSAYADFEKEFNNGMNMTDNAPTIVNAFMYTVFIKRLINAYETLSAEELVDESQNSKALTIFNCYTTLITEIQKSARTLAGSQKASDVLARLMSVHGSDANNVNSILCERIKREVDINNNVHSIGSVINVENIYVGNEYVRRCALDWSDFEKNPNNKLEPPLIPEDFISNISDIAFGATATEDVVCTDTESGVQVKFTVRESLIWTRSSDGGEA